jgi:hypothetical protein
MRDNLIPPEIVQIIGREKAEFAVQARRAEPISFSVFFFVVSFVVLAIASIIFFAVVMPSISKSAGFTKSSIGPLIFMTLLVLAGLLMFSVAIKYIVKKGGIFVGTESHLLHYNSGKLRSIEWKEFTGKIEVEGDNKKGSVTLELRSGRIIKKDKRNKTMEVFVPDTLLMCDIDNVFDIYKKCQDKIAVYEEPSTEQIDPATKNV